MNINKFLDSIRLSSHAIVFIENSNASTQLWINSYIKKIISLLGNNDSFILSKIDHNNYCDLICLDGKKQQIKKEDILEIQSQFSYPGIEYVNAKFYVIKHIENSSVSALNSLLKYLEEPSENTFCILTTTNIELVLPTIISRCNIVKIDNDDIHINNLLTKYNLNDIELRLYSNSFDNIDDLEEFLNSSNYSIYTNWLVNFVNHSDWFIVYELVEEFKNWDYSTISFIVNCLINYYPIELKPSLIEILATIKYNPIKTSLFYKLVDIIGGWYE